MTRGRDGYVDAGLSVHRIVSLRAGGLPAWVRNYYEATAPHSEAGGYINFMGDDQGRISANYRGNYDRLVDVKRRYDPGNLFHVNQNIKP